MRHLVLTLIFCLFIMLSAAPVHSKPPIHRSLSNNEAIQAGMVDFSRAATAFSLSAGYRSDKLNWSIAGNLQGGNPNILSELTWSDITICQLKLSNRTVIKDRVYVRGHLDYGMVISGDNRDSDYIGDNRTQEFSRSINSVDGNHVWDGSIGVGPRFSFYNATVIVCPLLGYGVSEQDFNIVDGYQALTARPVTMSLGPIGGLDSRYQTRWKGAWTGIDLLFSIPLAEGPLTSIGVMFSAEYHWVDFTADADWNLRTDLQHPVSFAHDASGSGVVVGATVLFETRSRWGFNLGMNAREMTADDGLDRIYYTDGTTMDTRLNEVKWRSFSFEAGLSYRF
jgi:hypothetical protein